MPPQPSAFPLTAIDREILAMDDSDYHAQDWSEVRALIAENKLEAFKRYPSDLRRYMTWCQSIKNGYGSITMFVLRERLHWIPLDSHVDSPTFKITNPVPFADESDYKVLMNDWPYGLAKDISHLVVWLKTPLDVDSDTGDLTIEARAQVESFVNDYFRLALDETIGKGAGKDRVVWFKNWVALQSVRGLDHVHVMVRDVPDRILKQWTQTS